MSITTPPLQTNYGGITNSDPLTLAFSGNTTAGSLLIFAVASNVSNTPVVTESLTETVLTPVAYGGDPTDGFAVGLYAVQNTAGGAVSFTATFGVNNYAKGIVAEYPGAATTGVVDTATLATKITSNPFSVGPLIPAKASSLAIAVFFCTNGSLTWSGGFTGEVNYTDGSSFLFSLADQIVSSSVSATETGFSGGAMAMALFKPPGSAPGGGSSSILLLGVS